MEKVNVLVFPCGSEVGLEIYKSLENIRFIELWGANSISDHGEYVYENYVGNLPYVNNENFIDEFKAVIDKHDIDILFPAMDEVAYYLKNYEEQLNCGVIASDKEVTETLIRKSDTYKALSNVVDTPYMFDSFESIKNDDLPVFIKPDIGYGSKGVRVIDAEDQLQEITKDSFLNDNFIALEYLPGDEFTVDCFSDSSGELYFAEARVRGRVKNGTSVRTYRENDEEFFEIAKKISNKLKPKYAWFFQLKRDANGDLKLLEVATRIGGSSSYYRVQGINFSLLSVYSFLGKSLDILYHPVNLIQDRALSNSYKLDLEFNTVYVDLDDCLIVHNELNKYLVKFLVQCLNDNKEINLITRHTSNVNTTLSKYRINNFFDNIYHVTDGSPKSSFIENELSILIDDSFVERNEVYQKLGIFTLSPDAVEIFF